MRGHTQGREESGGDALAHSNRNQIQTTTNRAYHHTHLELACVRLKSRRLGVGCEAAPKEREGEKDREGSRPEKGNHRLDVIRPSRVPGLTGVHTSVVHAVCLLHTPSEWRLDHVEHLPDKI